MSKHWRERGPKDWPSIPLDPPHNIYAVWKNTKYTQINTTKSSVTKPNPQNCKNCSSKCAYDCAQLSYTIQHRTVLIISPLTSRHSSDVVYQRRGVSAWVGHTNVAKVQGPSTVTTVFFNVWLRNVSWLMEHRKHWPIWYRKEVWRTINAKT